MITLRDFLRIESGFLVGIIAVALLFTHVIYPGADRYPNVFRIQKNDIDVEKMKTEIITTVVDKITNKLDTMKEKVEEKLEKMESQIKQFKRDIDDQMRKTSKRNLKKLVELLSLDDESSLG